MKKSVLGALIFALLLAMCALSQEPPSIANWAAPPYWLPSTPAGLPPTGQLIPVEAATAVPGREILALPSPPLPFVAVAPCRVADTRFSSYNVGAFLNGAPSLQAGVTRAFFVKGRCGIPQDAQAVSVNATVVNWSAAGFLSLFPGGGAVPATSTLNYPAPNGTAIPNAAIVPISSCSSPCGDLAANSYQSTDLIIDVNGYYSPLGIVNSVTAGTGLTGGGTGNVTLGIASGGVTSTELATNAVTQPKLASNAVTAGAIASGQVVKSLNGLEDSVTLAGAGGASVSQLGQTITVMAPAGLPSGSASQTLRNNGAAWAASSALTNDGTNINISGNLTLPVTTATTGQIRIGAYSFAHIFGTNNTFVGAAAGNLTLTGGQNTGVGDMALIANTSGERNTAVGKDALPHNTSGSGGTAVGMGALYDNTAGASNTAVGYFSIASNTTANKNTALGVGALYVQDYANGGTPWDADNTAVGYEALHDNKPTATSNGIRNTAVGSWAMRQNTTGLNNTAIGYQSLYNNNGSWNTAVGIQSLLKNTIGSQNTGVGDWAGHENQTGSNNVFLGNEAGYWETGSNRLYIANSMSSTLIYGQFDNSLVGINATDPAATLDVNGAFRVRTLPAIGGGNPVCTGVLNVFGLCGASDARLKKNIVSLSDERDVLSGLSMLRAVSFDWKIPPGMLSGRAGRDLGVIAQEVETVLPEIVSTGTDGYKSVDYSKLTAFLIEVAKAQQKEIEALKARLENLERAAARP